MKALLQKINILNHFDDVVETVKRFPLSVMCAGWVFVLTVLTIADIDVFKEETIGRIGLSLTLGYFWFGISQLVAESKGLNNIKHMALAILGFIPLLFITFGETEGFFRLAFIIPALLLFLMVAPFIRNQDSNISFWVFNRNVWFGVAVAIVAGGILAAGTSAALGAINYLFDLNLREKPYGYIMAFCFTILTPIYALAFIPKTFNFDEAQCNVPTQVNFIVNWILAPLIIVYMIILYAYFIKIGVNWEIPKGQLSFMITGFLGAGLVIYLISWPLHEAQSKALRFFAKFFFIAMLVPIVMQIVSIGMRIEQYGVTEKRYIVAASAVWFAFIAVGFLVQKLKLKHIPLSLAVLLLVSAIGPWSARDVSFSSQHNRMEAVLMEHNLLVEGKIIGLDTDKEVPFEVRQNISGIADYIFRHDHDFYGFDENYRFFKALNFNYVSKWENKNTQAALRDGRFNYTFSETVYNKTVTVSGVDYYIPRQYIAQNKSNRNRNKIKITDDIEASLSMLEGSIVQIIIGTGRPITFNLTELANKYVQESPNNNKLKAPIELEASNENYSVRLDIFSFMGKVKNDVAQVDSASTVIYITKR